MADRNVSDLSSIGSISAEDDELHIVDISEASPADEDKKVLVSDLRDLMLAIQNLVAATTLAETDDLLVLDGTTPKSMTLPLLRGLMGNLIELKDYQETLTAPAIASGVLTLDLELGNVFHVTLDENVATLTLSNPPSEGVEATGSFDLNDMGTADTIDTILVNGVDILDGAPVTWDTDLDVTGDAIVTEVAGNSTVPNYIVTHDGAGVVTIHGANARGVLDNGLVVATTETGFTVTNKTDMSGGSASVGGSFTLTLRQDLTGSRTFAWPASIIWAGGTAPTITSGANTTDVFTFFTLDGGTTWFGMTGGQDFS